MNMRLFLLSLGDALNDDSHMYLVAADHEVEAREILERDAPRQPGAWREHAACAEIGTAADDLAKGIVVRCKEDGDYEISMGAVRAQYGGLCGFEPDSDYPDRGEPQAIVLST